MASKVEICNMALSSLGSKQTIQDIESDNSTEARTLRLHYDTALQTALSYSEWTFARTWATSALLSAEPPTDWQYMYAEPANLIRLIEIVDSSGIRLLPPKKYVRTTAGGQKVILTDTKSPVWRYVFNNTDPVTYSSEFVDALAASLASRIAMAITRKRELREAAAVDYARLISVAAAKDSNQDQTRDEPRYMPEWFVRRNYHEDNLLYGDVDALDMSDVPGNF